MHAYTRCTVDKPFIFEANSARETFFENIVTRTLDAYDNPADDKWFVDAVHHRIIVSDKILVAKRAIDTAGYVGITDMHVAGLRIAYVGIVTVFKEWRKWGITSAMLEAAGDGYDAVMLRTQNPRMAVAMFQTFSHVVPLTERPSLVARRCAQVLADESCCNYDPDTFTCKGIYDGRRLTGSAQHGNAWAHKAMQSVNAEKGDAIILISFLSHKHRVA